MPLINKPNFIRRLHRKMTAVYHAFKGDGFIIVSLFHPKPGDEGNVNIAWNVDLKENDAKQIVAQLVEKGGPLGAALHGE